MVQLKAEYFYISVLALCLLLSAACSEDRKSSPLLTLDGLTMGTTYSIKINEPVLPLSAELINENLNDILFDINQKMSTYIVNSELSLINQNHTDDWLILSEELHYVLQEASIVSMITLGKFDITVGPLVNMWGFGPSAQTKTIPSDTEINDALAEIGFSKIRLRNEDLAIKKLNPALYIDLSGIAKGYAVDLMANYLEQIGIVNYMVEIGGEIRAKGVNGKKTSWRIGIEKPLTEKRSVQRIIKLDNIAMATSGDYRNYFEQDGVRYSHTIDPVAGRPINHKLVSVTVLHESATRADALATGFLVMGKEQAYELAMQNELAVLFIERSDSTFIESYTTALQPYLVE